jgi:hypothetical protein
MKENKHEGKHLEGKHRRTNVLIKGGRVCGQETGGTD